MDIEQIHQSETLREFAASVEQYCALFEHHADFSLHEFVKRCGQALAALYTQVLALPEADCDERSEVIQNTLNIHSRTDDTAAVNELWRRMRDFAHYWEVFDPYGEGKPLYGNLVDDLSDIYRDLMRGLVLYRLGSDEAICEAVWEWQFGFESHWGDHLVSGLRAIHRLIVTRKLEFASEQPHESEP